jgi:hypothetical protein
VALASGKLLRAWKSAERQSGGCCRSQGSRQSELDAAPHEYKHPTPLDRIACSDVPTRKQNHMVLIQDKEQSGVSFWYPFGFRPRRSGEVVKTIEWEKYRKWLPIRASLKIVLIGCGLLLFSDRLYTDNRYNLFALVVLISTAASVWAFIPRRTITVTSTTSVRLLPLAGIEFAGTFFALGIMMLVFVGQSDGVPVGAQGYELAQFCTHLWPLAMFLFLYGLLPVVVASAFFMKFGRSAS